MPKLTIGLVVRDVYTGAIGTVIDLDDMNNRAVVLFKDCRVTGCQSWFASHDDDSA